MSTRPEFTKGQKVNVFIGSHQTAAVTWKTYTVASCGQKQMHLVCDDGSNAEFRCYAPFRGDRRYYDTQAASVDPVEHAAKLRRQFAGWIREHYADRTRRAEESLANGDIGAKAYAEGIAEGKAKFEAATADLLEVVQ